MTLEQTASIFAIACECVADQALLPSPRQSLPALLLRGGAGGGVDRRPIFVMRVYNQGVQEQ